MLSPYFIILIVFAAVAVTSMLIFGALFIIYRLNLNDDYKLKIKYDFYKNNPIGSNLKSIETLVSKNRELEPILNYLTGCNIVYSDQLKMMCIQLKKVSDDLKTFRIFSTRKKLNQIKNNFNILDKHKEEFRKFNLNTQKYANNASQLATDLYDLIASLNNFNKDNLFSVLHPSIVKITDIDVDLNAISMQINKELNYVNYSTLHNLFIKEILKIKELYELSNNLFNVDKYLLAFDALFDLIIKSNKNSKLDNNKKIIITKKITQSKNHIAQIEPLLRNNEFDKAIRIYTTEIKILEDLLLELKVDEIYYSIYNEHFEMFKQNIMSFYHLIVNNKIKDLYKDILSNFKKDKSITDLIYRNIELINEIYKQIDDFNNLLNKHDFLNSINLAIKYIYSIYELTIMFKNANDKLLQMIEKKQKNFLEIMIKLHNLELKLSDLEKMCDEYNIHIEELVQNILEDRANIQEIRNSLAESTNINIDHLESRCDSIENSIQSSVEIIKVNINLFIIAKRLRLYANRYKDLATKQQISHFNQLYKNNKYYELIESYIEFIQKMKKQKRAS